jgi:SAM-dependent methyltransferase
MAIFSRLLRRRTESQQAAPGPAPAHIPIEGFFQLPGAVRPIGAMSPAELCAWENGDVPTAERLSDRVESESDEKQDPAGSLNFPLHWTTARESWDYLFDFAVACELLAPRPDDLVLDLAAGTCWATEFLNRLGVRTVSIDLSAEMMRRGRERLSSDTRLIFRNDARFVAARGQQLPFASESFDGVLCMNALHHHPSYPQVLGEIHRVLRPGGRAVFSEPGTTHPRQPLSVFRMREEHILEKPVALPLLRWLAREAGFSRMRVVPLRSASEYVFDYSATPADAGPLQVMWTETLKHSPGEHARFVLHKGGEPMADTLLPAVKLFGRLKAHLHVEIPARVRPGEPFVGRARVANAGDVIWRARGRRFGGQVTLGVKVFGSDGQLLREDLGRTPLPHDVAPGENVTVTVPIQGVLPAGMYELRIDMVVEGVTWFEFQGSTCWTGALEVR